MRQLAHPEIVDDEQRHRREIGEEVLALAVERGVGDLLDQHVRLAIDDAPALLDRGTSDRLREMALASAGRPEEERVLAQDHEARPSPARTRGRGSSSC